MGFRISYIASPVAPEVLAAAVNLAVAGESDALPERGWWVARLRDSGWSILWCADQGFAEANRAALLDLSHRAEVIFCEIDETTMWSAAEALSAGASLWRVTHAGDGEDHFDLSVQGSPPASLAGFRSAREQEQREDDGTVDFIFEVPQDLATERHGFRHDDPFDPQRVGRFLRLDPPQGRRRGLFGLFRRA